jgi:ribose transport system substrate-binding protein
MMVGGRSGWTAGATAALVLLAGCGGQGGKDKAAGKDGAASKWVVLDTRTDGFDFAKAKALAQDALARHGDLGCMVGLFEYNPPLILEAVKEAGRLKKTKIVAFDENPKTLQGIIDGDVEGTVVQNPYKYGYESVRVLAALAAGDKSVLPKGGFQDIPARSITRSNVNEYWAELKKLTAGGAAPETVADRPTVAYVTNGIADFWVIAQKGAWDGAREFKVNVEVRMPPSGVGDQKRMVQELLTRGVQGVAVSPIDPANQGDLLDEIAARTALITHDSDAPKSKRLVYIGMDNYVAGRMCGKLVKQALPEGGTVMIFVGRVEQENAKLRRQGVIDELAGAERSE